MRIRQGLVLLLASFFLMPALSKVEIKAIKYNNQELSVPIPAGWVLMNRSAKGAYIRYEYIPANESLKNHNNLIAIYIYPEVKDIVTSTSILNLMVEKSAQMNVCEGSKSQLYYPKFEPKDGTDTAAMLFYCTKQRANDRGEVSMYVAKKMKGRNTVFLVFRSWEGEPFTLDSINQYHPKLIKKLSAFIHEIKISLKPSVSAPQPLKAKQPKN